MIRLVIADDHELIREGLRKVFSREADIDVAASFDNAPEAIDWIRENAIDVVVLDVNMPGVSGIEALEAILHHKPDLPILMLSMLPEKNFAVRMLRSGAAGFVSKESAAEEIVDAVRRVAAGNKYVSPTAAGHLAAGLARPPGQDAHETLSNREFLVLRKIASGRGTRQISEDLDLSVNTVATYRRRILKKLRLASDVEITRYAIENQLLE